MNEKPKELEEHSAHIFEMGCMEQRVYLKNDADAVIEEIKQRYNDMDIAHTVHIAKMNAKIEELEYNVDFWKKENRRLKRALWLSRADRAMMTLDYFTLKCRWFQDVMKVEPHKFDVKMIHKWANIERKCRAMAEKFK